jgi:hypothetical protein
VITMKLNICLRGCYFLYKVPNSVFSFEAPIFSKQKHSYLTSIILTFWPFVVQKVFVPVQSAKTSLIDIMWKLTFSRILISAPTPYIPDS